MLVVEKINPNQCAEESAGKKFDKGKPRLELLPPSYWLEVDSKLSADLAGWYFYKWELPISVSYDAVPILEFGANKYAAHNWIKGMRWGRLVGAFHRHCNKLENGLWIPRDLSEADLESDLPHGAHAECCLLFLREYFYLWNRDQLVGENDCVWQVNK